MWVRTSDIRSDEYRDLEGAPKEIEANPVATQRVVSKKLGISLGKTNYILKELIKRGFVINETIIIKFMNYPLF